MPRPRKTNKVLGQFPGRKKIITAKRAMRKVRAANKRRGI